MEKQSTRVVIVGLGNIGQSVLPLIRRAWPHWRIVAIDQVLDAPRRQIIREQGIEAIEGRIERHNHVQVLAPLLAPGDFLINLAVEVCSVDLIALAQSAGAHYVDTCIDPWRYDSPESALYVGNYALREEVRALASRSAGRPIAVVAHGANPGFVSVLVKHALAMMGKRFLTGHRRAPREREGWARLACELGIRVIQVAERDTQVSAIARRPGEFVNTWSVDGFVTECLQPAELGWGTHETRLPARGKTHEHGCRAAISIEQPGFTMKMKSWSPNALNYDAYLISHNEAISIADYLSCREGERTSYRPTVYYAYHPCDAAVDSLQLLQGGGVDRIRSRRVMKDDITSGIDELGVFLLSDRWPALWIGSNLSIGKARQQAPYNSATSLQVSSSLVAALHWMLKNPRAGVVESEQMDHEFIFDLARDHWAPIVAEYVTWRPNPRAHGLQFADFLVASPGSPQHLPGHSHRSMADA